MRLRENESQGIKLFGSKGERHHAREHLGMSSEGSKEEMAFYHARHILIRTMLLKLKAKSQVMQTPGY